MVEILFIESFKIVRVKLISICKIRKIYFNGIYEKNWHDVVTLSMIKKGTCIKRIHVRGIAQNIDTHSYFASQVKYFSCVLTLHLIEPLSSSFCTLRSALDSMNFFVCREGSW